ISGPSDAETAKPALVRFAGEPAETRHPILADRFFLFLGGSGGPVEIEFTVWGPATVIVEKKKPAKAPVPVSLKKLS
ncbi:MAG: hypothetical protein AAGJ31_06580, partial [Verrucomicrobiota bacterium]